MFENQDPPQFMDPAQMHGHVYHAEPVFIQNLIADEDILDEK